MTIPHFTKSWLFFPTFAFCLVVGPVAEAITFREDFNSQFVAGSGGIVTRPYGKWKKTFQENNQSWQQTVPGNGFAYVKVNGASSNNDNKFQMIEFRGTTGSSNGYIGAGHTITARLKGGYEPGYTGFMFTYTEVDEDEIDIEMVFDDQAVAGSSPTVRLNTFNNYPAGPEYSNYQPVYNKHNVSPGHPLYEGTPVPINPNDGQFHTYVIDWWLDGDGGDFIDFYVDGKFQREIWNPAGAGATLSPQSLFFGFRDVTWALGPAWTGVRSMVIDYVDVRPNGAAATLAVPEPTSICLVGALLLAAVGTLRTRHGRVPKQA